MRCIGFNAVNIDNMSPVNSVLLANVLTYLTQCCHKFILTLSQRSKLQGIVYFWSMTVLLPPPSSLPPSPLFGSTCCHLLTAVPSSFPLGLWSMTGSCRPTLERDMGKFTNSAPACPGRQKLGISHWTLCLIAFVKAHVCLFFLWVSS